MNTGIEGGQWYTFFFNSVNLNEGDILEQKHWMRFIKTICVFMQFIFVIFAKINHPPKETDTKTDTSVWRTCVEFFQWQTVYHRWNAKLNNHENKWFYSRFYYQSVLPSHARITAGTQTKKLYPYENVWSLCHLF